MLFYSLSEGSATQHRRFPILPSARHLMLYHAQRFFGKADCRQLVFSLIILNLDVTLSFHSYILCQVHIIDPDLVNLDRGRGRQPLSKTDAERHSKLQPVTFWAGHAIRFTSGISCSLSGYKLVCLRRRFSWTALLISKMFM